MAAVFQAAGTAVSGTTATVSPAWPTHAINDVALLFVERAGGDPAPALTTANGFVQIGSTQTTGTGTAGTKLAVYWARATTAAMAAPVLNASTSHQYAVILTYRGVIPTGNPFDVQAGGVKATASTSATVSSVTTTVANALVVQAITSDVSSTAAFASAETNANLSSITERRDAGTISGDGGGLAVWDGTKAAAGSTGTTAVTVTSSINAFITISLKPYVARTEIPTTGLYTWYDANTIDNVAGAATTPFWGDETNNGHTAVQTTVGSQPTFQTNIKNGKPALQFNGTSGFLSAPVMSGDTFTIFAVFSATDNTNRTIYSNGSGDGYNLAVTSSGRDVSYRGAFDNFGSSYVGTTWELWSAVRVTGTNGNGKLYVNGTQDMTTTNALNPPATSSYIGKIDLGNFMAGYIAEIIVYNTSLNSTDQATVESYLATKYATPYPVVVTKTQPAVARIATARTKTQPATARLSQGYTKTQTSTSRIANTRTKTQPAISRITTIRSLTQPAISRVANTLTLTQGATANITSGGVAVQTYYQDGHTSITDPDAVWNNDSSAFDGSTATFADTLTIGSTSTNYLDGRGSTAPTTGNAITQVRVRQYANSGSINTLTSVIYTGGLGEQLGTVSTTLSTSDTYTSYVTLTAPTGGWTWAQVADLETKTYSNSASKTGKLSRIEFEVTSTSVITGTKNQSAIARIATTRSNTQTSISRISNTRTLTQLSIARMATNRTLTQPATARLAKAVPKTQPATARISNGRTKTQTSIARISQTYTKTQPTLARIATNRTLTQSATAKIITNTSVAKTQPATARIATNRSLTQTGVSRIANTRSLTQPGISRIANIRTLTEPAVARIATNRTKTQPAVSRIANIGTKIQPATGRIAATLNRTQPATSRISKTGTLTQPVVARAAQNRTLIQTATANITVNGAASKTQPATARIQTTRSATQTATSRISQTYNKQQTATARIANTKTKTQPAIARIAQTGTKTQPATSRIATARNLTQPVVSRISNIRTKTQPAIGRVATIRTKTQSATANIISTAQLAKTQTATGRIANTRSLTQTSTGRIAKRVTLTQPAVSRISATSVKTQVSVSRIANQRTKSQTATARITSVLTLVKTQTATGRIANTRNLTQRATARILSYDTTYAADTDSTATVWIPEVTGTTTVVTDTGSDPATWIPEIPTSTTVTADVDTVSGSWTVRG